MGKIPQTVPDVLVGTLRGSHRRQRVNVWITVNRLGQKKSAQCRKWKCNDSKLQQKQLDDCVVSCHHRNIIITTVASKPLAAIPKILGRCVKQNPVFHLSLILTCFTEPLPIHICEWPSLLRLPFCQQCFWSIQQLSKSFVGPVLTCLKTCFWQ